jgi:hypothetical protein
MKIKSSAGVEIRGSPFVRDHNLQGQDDRVLTDGRPSNDLIFSPLTVLSETGPFNLNRTTMLF